MSIQETVRCRLESAIKTLYDLDPPDLSIEVPPRTELGDLACPVAFELAKRLKAATGQKQNPRDIASRLAAELAGLPGVARAETAGAGYVNVFLDRGAYLLGQLDQPPQLNPAIGGKIIVEHTAVNPNKAAHIGHLRNAVLGDTIVRLLRATNEQVEIQNYIDNTGVQVADVVVGFKHLDRKTLQEVKAIAESAQTGRKFDYYCWDLYARVGDFYAEDSARLDLRSHTLHEIESGSGETAELADYIATRILNCHLDTMFRVGVEYDLLPRESDVLHLHIWERAFELLKERSAIEYETDGKLAGCWVMRSGDESVKTAETEHEADKVIVRSNGTVTYTGKDIAFHLWKLGQLEIDFHYKPFRTYPDGHVAWITTANPDESASQHPEFGRAAAYFNVIDIGQSYPQHYVKLGVMAVDRDRRVANSAHLAYEKVVLSPAAAEQLGQRLSEEDRKRGGVSMSGRKGLGVKTDDLIDQIERLAFAEVSSRQTGLSEEEQRLIARRIAVGALRYFLLKYTRTSIISFDFTEALAMVGETGVYIQNAVVRANYIFRKLAEAGIDTSLYDPELTPEKATALLTEPDAEQLWALVYLASRLPEVIRSAVASLEPAHLAKWAFQVAQNFQSFYEKHHVKSEQDPARRTLLIAITAIVRQRLISALNLLGIEAPERM
jgi:arginyl-tRNA synthetase